jgi:hypothetical protein
LKSYRKQDTTPTTFSFTTKVLFEIDNELYQYSLRQLLDALILLFKPECGSNVKMMRSSSDAKTLRTDGTSDATGTRGRESTATVLKVLTPACNHFYLVLI